MGFVTETISEADLDRYNSFHFISPFNGFPEEPWKWTIDRERNVVLVPLGGGGSKESDIPLFFQLIWQESRIPFRAFVRTEGAKEPGYDLYWDIFDIRIPALKVDRTDNILQFIREAIDAFGLYGTRTVVRSTITSFSQPIMAAPNKAIGAEVNRNPN